MVEISKEGLEKIDRQARAYGFEVGRGKPLVTCIEGVSDDNPFLNPNWRDEIDK